VFVHGSIGRDALDLVAAAAPAVTGVIGSHGREGYPSGPTMATASADCEGVHGRQPVDLHVGGPVEEAPSERQRLSLGAGGSFAPKTVAREVRDTP
jgi:hypothetical protein